MRSERGMTVLEIVSALAVIGIIAALAVPDFLPAKASVNEAAALAEVRQLVNAQATFAATHSPITFASLEQLAEAQLIDETLANGLKHDYTFSVRSRGREGFTIQAVPNTNTQRSFYSDETGVLRYETNGQPATKLSTPVGQEQKIGLIPVLEP